MVIVRKNDLNKFLKGLSKSGKSIKPNEIADIVGDVGINVAREEYAITGVTPNEIRKEVNGKQVEIVAVGEHLAFTEFGTGVLGEGTYSGNLPEKSVKLQFESPKGIQQSTDGWVYNYRKKQNPDKVEKDWNGTPAKAQMFKVSERLQKHLGEEIKNLKG
jgi:hypothetical protein